MNLDEYLSTQLKDGERLVRVVRPHVAMVLPALTGGAILVLMDFFLVAWWFRHHQWGVIGFVAVLIVAVIVVARSIYVWRMNVLLITTGRVIDMKQRGWFEKNVAEAPFEKIQDIRYSIRGLWSTLFHFGTVTLQTAGQEAMDIRYVVHPVKVQQELADLQQRRQAATNGPLSATELVTMVDQLKAQLGPEQLQRLLQRPPHGQKKV